LFVKRAGVDACVGRYCKWYSWDKIYVRNIEVWDKVGNKLFTKFKSKIFLGVYGIISKLMFKNECILWILPSKIFKNV